MLSNNGMSRIISRFTASTNLLEIPAYKSNIFGKLRLWSVSNCRKKLLTTSGLEYHHKTRIPEIQNIFKPTLFDSSFHFLAPMYNTQKFIFVFSNKLFYQRLLWESQIGIRFFGDSRSQTWSYIESVLLTVCS